MYPISSFLAISLITLLTAGLPHLLSQPPPPISHWRGVFSSLCIAPTPREQLHPSLSLSCPESAGRQFPYHSCKELQPSALQMVSMLEAVPHCLGKPLQQAISGNDTLLFCGLHNHRLENSPGKSYYPLKACRLFAVKSSSNFGQQFIIIIFFFYKVNRPTNISPAEQWYFTLRTHWFFIATYQSQYLKQRGAPPLYKDSKNETSNCLKCQFNKHVCNYNRNNLPRCIQCHWQILNHLLNLVQAIKDHLHL